MMIKPTHAIRRDAHWTILCDFDGTISHQDVTDTLLEAFGMPGWQELEQRWVDGEISSLACMSGQVALLDASKSELNACLSTIGIDPDFASFAAHARQRGIPLYIVSDGLDYAIHTILLANGISGIPVFANRLIQTGERRWQLAFPHASADCLKASGTCKCAIASTMAPDQFLMIGDGRSDFCVSRIASHVFARESLVAECQRGGYPFTAMNDFSSAPALLDALTQLPGAITERTPETLFKQRGAL